MIHCVTLCDTVWFTVERRLQRFSLVHRSQGWLSFVVIRRILFANPNDDLLVDLWSNVLSKLPVNIQLSCCSTCISTDRWRQFLVAVFVGVSNKPIRTNAVQFGMFFWLFGFQKFFNWILDDLQLGKNDLRFDVQLRMVFRLERCSKWQFDFVFTFQFFRSFIRRFTLHTDRCQTVSERFTTCTLGVTKRRSYRHFSRWRKCQFGTFQLITAAIGFTSSRCTERDQIGIPIFLFSSYFWFSLSISPSAESTASLSLGLPLSNRSDSSANRFDFSLGRLRQIGWSQLELGVHFKRGSHEMN